MNSKLIICLVVLAALVACVNCQLLPISGAHDVTGGYYDNYSGQYSSAITGRVYNTAPAVAYAAPVIARPAVVAAPAYAAAPVAWIGRR